eukprot:2169109-Prymnesium_polylepis.1
MCTVRCAEVEHALVGERGIRQLVRRVEHTTQIDAVATHRPHQCQHSPAIGGVAVDAPHVAAAHWVPD